MAGRAGRPRLDPYGEAVLIAKDRDAVQDLTCAYIEAPPEDVHSQCGSAKAICTHILSLVATGFAVTDGQIMGFLDRTFYVHENRNRRGLEEVVDSALSFLEKSEMVVRLGDAVSATELGTLVSRLYLDPRSAESITSCLAKVENFTAIGLLHLLCSTQDMPTLYLRQADLPILERYLYEHENAIWLTLPSFGDEECETFFRALKTALVLSDWTDEVGEAMICERYGINPGDIYSFVESVQWLVHAAARLSSRFAPHFAGPVRDMEVRVRIRRESGAPPPGRPPRHRAGAGAEALQQWHHGTRRYPRGRHRPYRLHHRPRHRGAGLCPARTSIPGVRRGPGQPRSFRGTPMTTDGFEVRTAIFRVSGCARFLGDLRAVASAHGTRIICFNADLIAGRAHVDAAIVRALRAVHSGTAISSSLEMEALLYASGSRQCTTAERFGIHEGKNRAYVCFLPPDEPAFRDLSALMEFVDEDWESLSDQKRERLREAFGITPAELEAAGPGRLRDLVLERVALLEVYR